METEALYPGSRWKKLSAEQVNQSVGILAWDKPFWTFARRVALARGCSLSWLVYVAVAELIEPGKVDQTRVDWLKATADDLRENGAEPTERVKRSKRP